MRLEVFLQPLRQDRLPPEVSLRRLRQNPEPLEVSLQPLRRDEKRLEVFLQPLATPSCPFNRWTPPGGVHKSYFPSFDA